MPPSPIIKASVNEQAWQRLCAELKLENPPTVRIVKGAIPGVNVGHYLVCYGVHDVSNNSITITLNVDEYTNNRLTAVASELSRTLLHEARHAWQHDNWTAEKIAADKKLPYERQAMEVDAREFEDRLIAYRGLVQVKRVFPGTGLSRLGRTESRVRQGV